MTKNAVLRVLVLAIMTMILSSCGGNSASGEGNSETAEAVSESEKISVATTAGTSETVTFCGEDVFSETDGISEDDLKMDENPAVNVKTEKISEEIYNSAGLLVGSFSAEYPIVSVPDGLDIDENVCERINSLIKEYINERLNEEQQYMYDLCVDEDGNAEDMFLFWLNDLERRQLRDISYKTDCNSGNILSVYFNEYNYGMAVPVSYNEPHTMIFDLRTGEQVDFGNMISDRNSFDSVFEKALEEHGGSYAEYNGSVFYPTGEDGGYMLYDQVTVKNDSVGIYFVPQASYDGRGNEICEIYVRVSDILPYLNESGVSLFGNEPEYPVVTPANEIYEFYPMKIIYPEKQETAVKMTTEKMQKDIFIPEGLKAAVFSAEYPVISGIDETVCKKINDEIKAYINGEFEAFSEGKDDIGSYGEYQIELMEEYGQPMYEKVINMTGTEFEVDGCDINGNILTVYFAVNYYMYGSNHGSEEPVPMLFDLRTGERIYFSGLIGDSVGLSGALNDAFTDFQFRYGEVPCGKLDADEYSEILELERSRDITIFTAGDSIEFGTDEDGIYRVALRNADERMTVYNGCVGFYLAPYEYGSYADGIRRVDIPASQVIPFLNDKGKSLFEGYASAESVPANVVEYKGGKYFDTIMWLPNIIDRDNVTEGDREFILLFNNIRSHILNRYKND